MVSALLYIFATPLDTYWIFGIHFCLLILNYRGSWLVMVWLMNNNNESHSIAGGFLELKTRKRPR